MAAGRRHGDHADAGAEARIAGPRVVHVAADLAVAVFEAHFAGKHVEHIQRLRLAGPPSGRRFDGDLLAVAGQHLRRAGTMGGGFIGGGTDQQVIAAVLDRAGMAEPGCGEHHQQDDQHRPRSVTPLPADHATSCFCSRPRPLRVAPGGHYRSGMRQECVGQWW